MRDLTAELPKPMVKVQGRPILQHILEGLSAAGWFEVLIIVGYRKEVIQNFCQDGANFGLRITYREQVVQDGTGKVVELAESFCGEDRFLLSYGDILVDAAVYRELAALPGPEMLLTVRRSDDLSKGGAVFVNENFEVTDLREKALEASTPWYNAGIYVFEPEIFRFIRLIGRSPRGEYELTDAIALAARSKVRIRAFEITQRWADVRDPEILASLNAEEGSSEIFNRNS